jgi:polysaccharide biosynthesis/export protein
VLRMRAIEIGLVVMSMSWPGVVLAAQAKTADSSATVAALNDAWPQSADDRPVLQQRNPRYRIVRDDVLMISFPLVPELNQKLTVQPDGYINLQGAGSLYVQEMTVPELVDSLKKAYSKILHDPVIDVDLLDFQKPFFFVSGQVNKPGQYDLRAETTVSEAIAMAGGLAPSAKTQIFLYHRISPGWMEVRKVKLKDILNGKHVNEDSDMQSGDMVFVPEKFISNFRKYVPYSFGMYLNPTAFF